MLRKVIKYFFLGLVLLLVFLSSALLAMRFAIQGREVHVPRLSVSLRLKPSASLILTVWFSPWKAASIVLQFPQVESFRNRPRRARQCAADGKFAWPPAWEHNTPLCPT